MAVPGPEQPTSTRAAEGVGQLVDTTHDAGQPGQVELPNLSAAAGAADLVRRAFDAFLILVPRDTDIAQPSQVRQVLRLPDQRGKRVADRAYPVDDRAQRPSVGSQVGVVSSSQLIGTETGAPDAGRALNGATSVLLIAFWV